MHIKEHNRAILNAAATMRKDVSKSRPGRSTMVTTVTDELEELDAGLVIMSYELPQESEQMTTEEPPDPEEDPGEAVLFQLVVKHETDDGPNHALDNARAFSVPQQLRGPPPELQPHLNSPRQPGRHSRVYNLIKTHHSIFDSTNTEPSYWYCIGGRGNGKICNNYESAIDRVVGTFVYSSGHVQGFQSIEAARLYRTEVTRELATIMTDRKDYMIHAFVEGNMIKVQLYPQLEFQQLPGELAIYNTLPTSDDDYYADRSLLDTYVQEGGTIPTDVDQHRTLLARLRSTPADDPRHATVPRAHTTGENHITINPTPTGVHTRGVIHTQQSPREFRQYYNQGRTPGVPTTLPHLNQRQE